MDKNKKNLEKETNLPSLKFTLMPKPGKKGKNTTRSFSKKEEKVTNKDSVKTSPPIPPKPANLTQQVQEHRNMGGDGGGEKKRWFIYGSVLVVLIIAGTAVAIYMNLDSKSNANPSPAVNNQANQNLNKDSDSDGLFDSEEKDYGTQVQIADTDGDGLSDGDEVKIFKTDPFTPHTDEDVYADGEEIANGYDPLVAGDIKLSQEMIDKIVEAYTNNNLHEPTISTLKKALFWQDFLNNSEMDVDEEKVEEVDTELQETSSSDQYFSYEDPIYGYQLVIPGEWKKSGDGQTNLVFIEQESSDARYVQIQAVVNVSEEGDVSSDGLLESEIKRLAETSLSGVSVNKHSLGGLPAFRMVTESKRVSSGVSDTLNSAVIEYVVNGSTASFIVTAACTSDVEASCLSSLQNFSTTLEEGLTF